MEKHIEKSTNQKREKEAIQSKMNIPHNVISTSNRIIEHYGQGRRWVILFSDVQSGKSSHYARTICEMFRLKKIKQCIIFSGNPEKYLEKQTENKFQHTCCTDYCRYLEAFMPREEATELAEEWINKTKIVWGNGIKNHINKKSTPMFRSDSNTEDTLIVFDESHCAQNQGMLPHKLLNAYGISPNGNIHHLQVKNNYVLSVSATPFSELSDTTHLNQSKVIVRGDIGDHYTGIPYFWDNGNIQYFEDWKIKLTEMLERINQTYNRYGHCMFGIVRVYNQPEMVKLLEIVENCHWNCVQFTGTENNGNCDDIVKTLQQSDLLCNTIIALKGKGRMGWTLPMQNVAFVMETANQSCPEALIQGLVGRCCGYTANQNIEIYISKCNYESTTIPSYIELCNTTEEQLNSSEYCLPPGFRNSSSNENRNKRVKLHEEDEEEIECYPIIPIKIKNNNDENLNTANLVIWANRDQDGSYRRNDLFNRVKNCFDTEDVTQYIESDNPDEQLEDIKDQILKDGFKHFERRKLKKCHTTYENVPEIIYESIQTKTPRSLNTSCGVKYGTIKIYVAEEAYPEFNIQRGNIYIDARTRFGTIQQRRNAHIGKTNGQEIFCCNYDENDNERMMNGAYIIPMPMETHDTVECMEDAILECIQLSQENATRPRYLQSLRTGTGTGNHTFNGIYVTNHVLNALMPNGSIYELVKQDWHLELQIQQATTQSNELKDQGIIRLAKIAW